MKHLVQVLLGVVFASAMFTACAGDETQKVRPATQGARGENCEARNDCASGLACINGVCSKNDFDIKVAAKQCDVVECQKTAECCGDRPTKAPAKCNGRETVCSQSEVPNCPYFDPCSGAADCNGGTCGNGQCSNSGYSCDTNGDCATDYCQTNTACSSSGQGCVTDADCIFVGEICTTTSACYNTGSSCATDADCTGTCEFRSCDCSNPAYDPGDPICRDPDCDDVCTLKCDEERCVVDDSCDSDSDCPFNRPTCEQGSCVECTANDDCGDGEKCREGRCDIPCTDNEECSLFHECKGGECVETGCKSDRECVLARASTGGGSEDARLSKCLPSEADPNVNTCKVPCENDGACGSQFQVCDGGFCVFVGCESDEECRGFLGLSNQQKDEFTPYVAKAVCRE